MAIYYVDSFGYDPQALSRGVDQAVVLAKCSKWRQAAIAFSTKKKVLAGMLEEAIGRTKTKGLASGALIIDGCTLYLFTERIDPPDFAQGPILAVGISAGFLQTVLTDWRATDIIYLPWERGQLADFKHNNPTAIDF